MCFQHDEIIAEMAETIEQISIACSSRVKPASHLEADDDDYEFVPASLDRWSDRSYARQDSRSDKLEREATRILTMSSH